MKSRAASPQAGESQSCSEGTQSQYKSFRACGEPWNFTMAGSFNAASKSRPAPMPSVQAENGQQTVVLQVTFAKAGQALTAPRSVI